MPTSWSSSSGYLADVPCAWTGFVGYRGAAWVDVTDWDGVGFGARL